AEDAVEDLGLVLAEVVVAQASRQAEPGARPGALAEGGELVELVVQVGPEEDVPGGVGLLGGDAAQLLEVVDEQALAVVALRVGVEAAGHPPETALAAGPAELLRPGLRGA